MSASSSQTIETSTSYCRFGCENLTKLLEVFEGQISGVIENKDIEYIHKMRVASRKIRIVLSLFRPCFPKKKFDRWLKEIKKITQLLSEARDLDVQIAFLQAYIQKQPSTERAGLESLLKNYKNRRKTIQAIITGGLQELQNLSLVNEMKEFTKQVTLEPTKEPFDALSVIHKAHLFIAPMVNDFLSFEKYVHQEKAFSKHHKMRIKAKWLRYTLEVFEPLYKSKLTAEIQTLKNFQDVLGEMHDCDVWIDSISKIADKSVDESKVVKKSIIKAGSKQALNRFLLYLIENKKSHYEHFVQLWADTNVSNFFNTLRETAGDEIALGISSVLDELNSKRALKMAVLADIHANLHALEAVVQDAEKRGADVFLNAGDSIGLGAFPNEVLELLYSKNCISVIGNFDLKIANNNSESEKEVAVEFAKKELEDFYKCYLLSFPSKVFLEVAGKKLLMVHGSPKSIEEHVYHDTPVKVLEDFAVDTNADLIIVGHSHEQFERKVNNTTFVNPGSVGRPDDGNPQAAYALLSFSPFKIELIRLSYNVKAAADALRRKRLPEIYAQMLLRGLSVENVIQEDKAKRAEFVRDNQKMVKTILKQSKKYCPDTEHVEQVTRFALLFFENLVSLHNLGARERCWLECAAILHDIGLFEGAKNHHKKSMKTILNNVHLPFSSDERRVIASIVRYHRKGLPKNKHYNLATLTRTAVQKIRVLSSLLRVADALDYSHNSVVTALKFNVDDKKVAVQYVADSRLPWVEKSFNKKKDLFEDVFKKKLVLRWMQL